MPEELDDRELAQKAAKGDRQAFTVLLRRHTPRWLILIRAQGVPDSDLEDVAQEAAIAVWRHLATFNAAKPFAPWAAVVAANKARDWGRRRSVRAFWLRAEPLLETGSHPEDQPGTDVVAASRVDLETVRKQIARLPDKLRLPLLLTAIGGFTQVQAAAELGITTKALELRIARARKLLEAAS